MRVSCRPLLLKYKWQTCSVDISVKRDASLFKQVIIISNRSLKLKHLFKHEMYPFNIDKYVCFYEDISPLVKVSFVFRFLNKQKIVK